MSTITKGEVEIVLAGETHVLKPSLNAFTRVNSMGAYRDVMDGIQRGNLAVLTGVLRHGLGWNDAQSKKLPELIFRTGVNEVTVPVLRFAFSLFNGGKTPDEVLASASAEGNDEDAG